MKAQLEKLNTKFDQVIKIVKDIRDNGKNKKVDDNDKNKKVQDEEIDAHVDEINKIFENLH